MKPSVGRIIHYTSLGSADGKYSPELVPAIIVGVNDDGTVALHTFYRTGQFNLNSVEHTLETAGTAPARGKWAWPERI